MLYTPRVFCGVCLCGTHFKLLLCQRYSNFIQLKSTFFQVSVKLLSSTTKDVKKPPALETSILVHKNQEACLKKIKDTFQCQLEDAYILMKLNHKLLYSQIDKTIQKVKLFHLYGLRLDVIRENIWLLTCKEVEIKQKLAIIKQWKLDDFNSGVKFISLSITKLLNYNNIIMSDMNNEDGRNRIKYFSDVIKCSEFEACNMFFKNQFLLTLDLDRFKSTLHVQLDEGIKPENLLTDVLLFRYSVKWINEKIKRLKSYKEFYEHDVVLKPWMLRCLPSRFERNMEIKTQNKYAIVPYESCFEFLRKELNLSKEEVELMIKKHPPLKNVSRYKLKVMIEFLKSEKFDSTLVFKQPRILCHSQATIKARLYLLRSLNYNIRSLCILCKNRKDFVAIVERIKNDKAESS